MLLYDNGLIIVDYPEPPLINQVEHSRDEIDRLIQFSVNLMKKYNIKPILK